MVAGTAFGFTAGDNTHTGHSSLPKPRPLLQLIEQRKPVTVQPPKELFNPSDQKPRARLRCVTEFLQPYLDPPDLPHGGQNRQPTRRTGVPIALAILAVPGADMSTPRPRGSLNLLNRNFAPRIGRDTKPVAATESLHD